MTRRRISGHGPPTFKWEPQTYLASDGGSHVYTTIIAAGTYIDDRLIEYISAGDVLGSSAGFNAVLATGAPGSEVSVLSIPIAVNSGGLPVPLPTPIRLPAGVRLSSPTITGVNTTIAIGHRSVADLRRIGLTPGKFATSISKWTAGGSPPAAASGTPGAWTEVWAAGAGPAGNLLIVAGLSYQSASSLGPRVEFASGAGGSEVSISVPQIVDSQAADTPMPFITPFIVPSGARLSFRAYDNPGAPVNLLGLYYVSPTTPGYALP